MGFKEYSPARKQWNNEIEASGNRLGGCWSPWTSGSSCPDLLRWLVEVFPIRTAIDVGCGCGSNVRSLNSLGVQTIGIEFLRSAAKITNFPTILHDMEKGPCIIEGIDLAFSMEFVEHCSNVDSTIDTLANGKVVCFSHAMPDQAGEHHVMCCPDEFWIERMMKKGYDYLEELSINHVRRLAGGSYLSTSGLLFIRQDLAASWGTDNGCYRYRSNDPRWHGTETAEELGEKKK